MNIPLRWMGNVYDSCLNYFFHLLYHGQLYGVAPIPHALRAWPMLQHGQLLRHSIHVGSDGPG
jgi:hypothetical protein